MIIRCDPDVDALSIVFREATVTTKHLGDGIAADDDADGVLAGLEILDAAKRLGGRPALETVALEIAGRNVVGESREP